MVCFSSPFKCLDSLLFAFLPLVIYLCVARFLCILKTNKKRSSCCYSCCCRCC
jgi:hypothetical protein